MFSFDILAVTMRSNNSIRFSVADWLHVG